MARSARIPTFSVTELAAMWEMTKGAMSKRLEGLDPDEQTARTKRFRLLRVIGHFQGGDLDPTFERARLAKEQADKLAMENEVTRGNQVSLDAYEEQCAADARQLVAFLDALPLRLRQGLPHMTPVDHATIETILAENRSGFYDELVARSDAAGRPPPARDAGGAEAAAAAGVAMG